MQAVFRFKGSEEIVVSNTPGGVLVEHIRDRNPLETAFQPERDPRISSGLDNKTIALISLSKSGARSVASAMMQAAAEA